MAARWTDPEQPHAVERADTWLLVMFLLLFLVPLAYGLAL